MDLGVLLGEEVAEATKVPLDALEVDGRKLTVTWSR